MKYYCLFTLFLVLLVSLNLTCGFPSRFSDDSKQNAQTNLNDNQPKTIFPVHVNPQEDIEKQNNENDRSFGGVHSDESPKGSNSEVVKGLNEKPVIMEIVNGTQQKVDGESSLDFDSHNESNLHLEVEKEYEDEPYKITSELKKIVPLPYEPSMLNEQVGDIEVKNSTLENTGHPIETSIRAIAKSVENEMSKAIAEDTTLGAIKTNAPVKYDSENNGEFDTSSILNPTTMITTNSGLLLISENSLKTRNISDETRVPHKETISEYSNRKYDMSFIYPFIESISSALQESEGFRSRMIPRSVRSLDEDVLGETAHTRMLNPDQYYEGKDISSLDDAENTINSVGDIVSSVEDSNEFYPTNLVSDLETTKSVIHRSSKPFASFISKKSGNSQESSDFSTHSTKSLLDSKNDKESNEALENENRYTSLVSNVKHVDDDDISNKKDFLDNSSKDSRNNKNITREKNFKDKHGFLEYTVNNQHDNSNNDFADTISSAKPLSSSAKSSMPSEGNSQSSTRKNIQSSAANKSSSKYNKELGDTSNKFERPNRHSQGKYKVVSNKDPSKERSNQNKSVENVSDKPVSSSEVNYDSFEEDDYDEYPDEYEFDQLGVAPNNEQRDNHQDDQNKATVCRCQKMDSSKKTNTGINPKNSNNRGDVFNFDQSRQSPRKNSAVLLSELLRNIGANQAVNSAQQNDVVLINSGAGPLLISSRTGASNILGPILPVTLPLKTAQNIIQDENSGNLAILRNLNSGEFSQQLGNLASAQRTFQNGGFGSNGNVLVNQNSPALLRNTFPSSLRNVMNEAIGGPIPVLPLSLTNNANSNVNPLTRTSQNDRNIGVIVIQNGNTAQINVTEESENSVFNRTAAQNSNLVNVFVNQKSDTEVSTQTAPQNNNGNIAIPGAVQQSAVSTTSETLSRNTNTGNLIVAQNGSPSQNTSSTIPSVVQQSETLAPLQSMLGGTNGANILVVQNLPLGPLGQIATQNNSNSGVVINQQPGNSVPAQIALLNNNTNIVITGSSASQNTGPQTVNIASPQVLQQGLNSVTVQTAPQNTGPQTVNIASPQVLQQGLNSGTVQTAPQNTGPQTVNISSPQVLQQGINSVTVQTAPQNSNTNVVVPENITQNFRNDFGILIQQQSGILGTDQNLLGSQNSGPLNVLQNVPQNVNANAGTSSSNQITSLNFNSLGSQNSGPVTVQIAPQNVNTNTGVLVTQGSENLNFNQIVSLNSNLLNPQNSVPGNSLQNVNTNAGLLIATQQSENLSQDQILSSSSNFLGVQNSVPGNVVQNVNNNVVPGRTVPQIPQNFGPGGFLQNLPQNSINNNAFVPTLPNIGFNQMPIQNFNLLGSQNPIPRPQNGNNADVLLTQQSGSFARNQISSSNSNFLDSQNSGPLSNVRQNLGADQISLGSQLSGPIGPLSNVRQNLGAGQISLGSQLSVPNGPLPNDRQNLGADQISLGSQISVPIGSLPNAGQNLGADQISLGSQLSVPIGPLSNIPQNLGPDQILFGSRGLLPTAGQSVTNNANVIMQQFGNLVQNQVDSPNSIITNLIPQNSGLGGVSQATPQNFNSATLLDNIGDLGVSRAVGLLPNLNSAGSLISQQSGNVNPVQYLPVIRNNEDLLVAQSLGIPISLQDNLQLDNRFIVNQPGGNLTTTQPGPQTTLPIFNISPNEAFPAGIYMVGSNLSPSGNILINVRQNSPGLSAGPISVNPNIGYLGDRRVGLTNSATTGGQKIFLVDQTPRTAQTGSLTALIKSQQLLDGSNLVRLISNDLGSISTISRDSPIFKFLPAEKRPNNKDVCSCGRLIPEHISSRDDVVTLLPNINGPSYRKVMNPRTRQRLSVDTTDGYDGEFETLLSEDYYTNSPSEYNSEPYTFDSHEYKYVEPSGKIGFSNKNPSKPYTLTKMTTRAEKNVDQDEFKPRSLGIPNSSEDSSLRAKQFEVYETFPSKTSYESKETDHLADSQSHPGKDHLADSQSHPGNFGSGRKPKLYKYEPKNSH